MHQLIAIIGPTGSGKTELAVALAKKFNGILVSADSRQVYRGLDVGTNKEGRSGQWLGQPARIIDQIPQLIIDVADAGDRFSLSDWLDHTKSELARVMQANKLPIIVGGTGLYVSALLDGYELGEGRHSKRRQPTEWKSLVLMPEINRDELFEKSNQRIADNFDRLVTETKQLISKGVAIEWLDKIGLDYRYAAKFIAGLLTHQEAIEQCQTASRQYIRRQLTWWRHHNQPTPVTSRQQAEKLVGNYLTN